MKILLGIHQFFPIGSSGTEVLTLEVARGLRRSKHSVSILTCKEEPETSFETAPWMTKYEYDEFPVYCLHYGVAGIKDSITSHTFAPDRVRLVKNLVSEMKPDLIHFYHIKGFSASIIPELRQQGVPVVFTPTDYWVVCPKFTLLRTFDQKVCDGPGDAVMCVKCFKNMPDFLARWRMKIGRTFLRKFMKKIQWPYSLGRRVKDMTDCVNSSNQILTETKFLSNILIRHGVNERLIEVVPTGVDIGEMPEHTDLPLVFSSKQPLHMGFVGTLSSIKGPQIILDALSLLGESGRNVILDIYGKQNPSDPFFQVLLNKAKSLSVEVRFRGVFSHEQMGQVLRSFHLLVIPSIWYESAPLVLCSALAAGTPVAVSRLEGMTEIMEEGTQGYSFPAGDAKALRDLILRILENPKMLRKIYQNPHLRKRSTEDYVRDIEARYRQVLK